MRKRYKIKFTERKGNKPSQLVVFTLKKNIPKLLITIKIKASLV